jgi:hypothetical protein
MSISLMFDFAVTECCVCGIAFAVPARFKQVLQETHRTFYCPNGHGQSYLGQTEVERLRDKLKTQNSELEVRTRALLNAQVAEAKLRKRIAGGVCPCCNRTFQNLARHMSAKHKSLGGRELSAAAEPKRLQ